MQRRKLRCGGRSDLHIVTAFGAHWHFKHSTNIIILDTTLH